MAAAPIVLIGGMFIYIDSSCSVSDTITLHTITFLKKLLLHLHIYNEYRFSKYACI